MRTTGLGFSILLLAAGAVMAWAVNVDAEGFDINLIGLILFVVGIVGFVATFALASTPNRTIVDEERRDVRVDARS